LGIAPNVQAVQPIVQATNPPTFGTQQPSTLSFGNSQQQPIPQGTTTGISFGQPANVPATTAPPSFNFGQTATTATAPTSTPSLLSLSTTAQTTSGLFAAPTQPLFSNAITTSANPVQSAPPNVATTTAQQSFIGLGGIDMSSNQQKAPEGKIEATKVKETQVPIQIMQSVEEFKNYIKNQKTMSSEITRSTDRKLKSVTDEIQRLDCSIQEASNTVDTNRSIIKHLRNETSQVIENADMAQRTHETPSGLQFENVLPQIYFKELIQRYETDLLNLKHQVELTEKHLQSLANPQNFSAQDLKRGLQQTHECFIALAGRVQDAHTKVEKQKEDYLQLRKFILRDSSNVFAAVDQEQTSSTSINRVQYGPNVFSLQGGFNIQKPQQLPQTQSQAFNIGGAGNSSLFGTTNFGFNK
jgi:nucleoporin p58/p45